MSWFMMRHSYRAYRYTHRYSAPKAMWNAFESELRQWKQARA